MSLLGEGVLTRRRVLAGTGLLLVLAACGTDNSSSTVATAAGEYAPRVEPATPAAKRNMFTSAQVCADLYRQLNLIPEVAALEATPGTPSFLPSREGFVAETVCDGTSGASGGAFSASVEFPLTTQEDDGAVRDISGFGVYGRPGEQLNGGFHFESGQLCGQETLVVFQFPASQGVTPQEQYGCHA